MIPSIHVAPSSFDSVRRQEVPSQRLSFEDLKARGCTPINDKILKVTYDVYIYLYKGKPLILSASDFFTKVLPYGPCYKCNNFIYGSVNELTLLVSAHNHNEEELTYSIIPLEGETLRGKDAYKCTLTQEQLSLILSESPIEQLNKLGFIEQRDCSQYVLEKKENTLQNLLKQKQTCEISIISLQERLQDLRNRYINDPLNKGFVGFERGLTLVEESRRKTLYKLQQQINIFEMREEPLTRIYIKEIPDEINHQHKVFLVQCEGNQINKIFTTLYRSRDQHEIQGEIIDIDLEGPTFILQEAQQKKFEVKFRRSHNEFSSYSSVSCEELIR